MNGLWHRGSRVQIPSLTPIFSIIYDDTPFVGNDIIVYWAFIAVRPFTDNPVSREQSETGVHSLARIYSGSACNGVTCVVWS